MKSKIILTFILLLAAAVRLTGLTGHPSGFNADEAALGYNAYSLLLTGRDEHGSVWPVNLESFGDFKPALYAYILIPFIKVFGLTELVVRLPSALSGILSVWLLFKLVAEIFPGSRYRCLPHVTALFLSISPWAIHYSRGAWEVNVATTLLIFGVWQFLRWKSEAKIRQLLFSVTALVASMYTYQSARILAPMLGLACFLAFFRHYSTRYKQLLVAAIVTAILLLPLTISLFTSDAASRFSGVGFLSDEGPVNRVNEFRGQHGNKNFPVERILHNRPVIYVLQFIKNYSDHFDGNFLFVNGDIIQRNRIPETGQLYLTDFIFLFMGIFVLIRFPGSNSRVVWLWLLIAPIPAALTFQTPHALRAQNLVVPLTILVSLGTHFILSYMNRQRLFYYLSCSLLFLVYSYQFSRLLHQYFIHYPAEFPAAWEYGFKDVVDYVARHQADYDRVIITDSYDQPYILFLFYLRYPPAEFQNHHILSVRDKFNFSTVRDFSKYSFTSTSWEKVKDVRSALIIAAPSDLPPVGVNVVDTINFQNGQPAFKIVSQ